MLRVTVELIPLGIEEFKETLGSFLIANTGIKLKNGETMYDYEGVMSDMSTSKTVDMSGFVFHNRDKFVLELLYKVLEEELKK